MYGGIGERPRRRAAEKRNELAALQLIELHLIASPARQHTDWRASSHGPVAVRDFDPAERRFGS
jgi:hypothetical protein